VLAGLSLDNDEALLAGGDAPHPQAGPRRPPERCLRAPISQCLGATGHNEEMALPFPHHGNAPQHGEAPAAFGHPRGKFWGPVLPPRQPRAGQPGQNRLTPRNKRNHVASKGP
jgi:hypothetical protein